MIDFFHYLPLLQAQPGGQMVTMVITFGLIIAVFYFLVIRPQNKRQREAKNMLAALKKGDKIATIGGIRGVVTAVKDQTVTVKVDENTKIEFNKGAVSSILERKEGPAEPGE